MFKINMEFKKTFNLDELKKTMTRIENIAIFILILSIFLPFVEVYLGFNGFAISGFKFFFHKPLMFVIPLLGLIAIGIRPTCEHAMALKNMKLTIGVFSILSFVYYFFSDKYETLFGFYVFALLGIIIILGSLDKFQLSKAEPHINIPNEIKS